jgi:ABC-2 type transport system ATP-binding protein
VLTGLGWMTAGDLLAYTRCFYDHWNDDKVRSLVRDWEVDPHAKVSSMSEGEKQKLAIIQAMGHEPDLFIFDEPVASLDPLARRTFIRELIELNAGEGKTMLFSTHITSDLERVAADIALLKEGEIQFAGSLASLKERVVRLHIQADEPLPEPLPIANTVGSRVNGGQAVVTVESFDQLSVPEIERSLSAKIRVEHLNLEEIFLELYQ